MSTTTIPDLPVIGYATLQWTWGGLFTGAPARHDVCLVRSTGRGTPGNTLCGRDRFSNDERRPGWSVGGGVTDREARACPGCAEVLAREPLPVRGTMFRHLFEGYS